MSSKEIFQQWVAAINGHDMAALTALLAVDHLFVDSLGNRLDHAMAEGDTLLGAGEAGGTIDGESWQIPAAWKAMIRDGSVVEWRVFADNKPVYEILGRRRP